MIDASMPLVTSTEVDKDGYGGTITREIERLNMIGSRIHELEGISGAAVLDRELGCVIGVEGLYTPDVGEVRGTEIAQLVDEHPELQSYFQPIFSPPEPLKTGSIAALASRPDEGLPSAVPTAGAASPLEVRVWAQLDSVPLAGRLGVQPTRLPDAVFKVGDYVRIGFYATRDAYIYLLNVDAEGKAMQLFPAEHRVGGNQSYFIPAADDDFALPVEGPPGVETLIALATVGPVPILDEWRRSSELLSRRALRLSEEELARAAGALSRLPREQWAVGKSQFLVRGKATA